MRRQSGSKQERADSSGAAVEVPAAPPAPLAALRLLAFVAGAVLMALEVVGSRLLAPHFGNSVFVWGSLITVFLTALACGYYLGGRIADRWPSLGVLLGVAAAAGVLIAAIPAIGHPFLGWLVALGLDEQGGPLVGSLVLFLPPSLLLGAVSPLAVRLAAPAVAAVGRTAGTLYALSTLGSIAGTLAATFVLIPALGVAAILRLIGAVMALTSALLLLARPGRKAAAAGAIAATVAALALPGVAAFPLQPGDVVVERKDTPYHQLAVVERGDKRLLLFNRFVQSGITIAPPHASVGLYTDYFHLAFLARPELGRVLFLGAGGGIGPREFLAVSPRLEVDVVDIDPAVLRIAERHFHMPVRANLHATAGDARIFLQRRATRWDAIVLDAFTVGGRIPFHLTTREFFALCRARLADGGVLVMNLNSARTGERSAIFAAVTRTLATAFPHVHAFVTERERAPDLSQSIVLVALAGAADLDPAAWSERAQAFAPRSLFEAEYLEKMIGNEVPLPPAGAGELLSDDHVPIETMRF